MWVWVWVRARARVRVKAGVCSVGRDRDGMGTMVVDDVLVVKHLTMTYASGTLTGMESSKYNMSR